MEVGNQLARLHSFEIEIDGRKRAVVHGDIKPSNIQICPDGAVRLLDFGISKAITFTHGLTHHNLGSPSYCSPERLRRAQVDPHSDLWALGATLYEMVAGRPPRALPEECPAPLKAVIRKALAGDIENRYPTAGALEDDLRKFVDGQLTLAETEKQSAWEVHPTVEKDRGNQRELAKSLREIAPWPKIVAWLKASWVPVAAVAVGALLGSLVYIESAYAYRFWIESKPLRGSHDYTRRSVAEVNADWDLYKTLERRYLPLGRQFDWRKAQICLEHAAELDGSDTAVKGNLALSNAYLALLESPQTEQTAARAKAGFEEAHSYLSRSPDPHLGLARIYVYHLRNIGRAVAELSDAERLGFKPGPREFEQQGDGAIPTSAPI